MHDGMHYDPIQGQGQGHELLKVGNSAVFNNNNNNNIHICIAPYGRNFKGYLFPH